MYKTILMCLAVQAISIKSTYSQCIGRGPFDIDYAGPYPNVYDGMRNSPFPFGLNSFSLSSAFNSPYGPMSLFGNFPFSKITITGNPKMSVLSDNIVEGLVSVAGRLPFLGTVAVEGTFPTVGTGIVNYNCGGLFGIFNELPGPVLDTMPIVTPTFAPAMAPTIPAAAFGYGPYSAYDCSYAPNYGVYDAYVGDGYGYGPSNYGPYYDPSYIDGYNNNFNGYGYGTIY